MSSPSTIFEDLFKRQNHYFLQLKRLDQLQMQTLEACDGRPIRNDLIYNQMLFASIDGLFVRLANFERQLQSFLNELKTTHLDRFKRNTKRGLDVKHGLCIILALRPVNLAE